MGVGCRHEIVRELVEVAHHWQKAASGMFGLGVLSAQGEVCSRGPSGFEVDS
jgi:hypothetical protein